MEDTRIQTDDRLKRLSDFSVGLKKDSQVAENPKTPWSLFDTAPEVGSVRLHAGQRAIKKQRPQISSELLFNIEQSALDDLNKALSMAFGQILRGKKRTFGSRSQHTE
jgi:hypothetical protein